MFDAPKTAIHVLIRSVLAKEFPRTSHAGLELRVSSGRRPLVIESIELLRSVSAILFRRLLDEAPMIMEARGATNYDRYANASYINFRNFGSPDEVASALAEHATTARLQAHFPTLRWNLRCERMIVKTERRFAERLLRHRRQSDARIGRYLAELDAERDAWLRKRGWRGGRLRALREVLKDLREDHPED